jgi:hypothetical protein
MATQSKCSYCDPPGSGCCKDCQATGKSGKGSCRFCQGSGYCRHCYGTGLERSSSDRVKSSLLGVWWTSWFGIIGAFLLVGVWEYRIGLSTRRGASHFSLLLLIVTVLLWVLFFVLDERVRGKAHRDNNWPALVLLSTLAGTILVIFTLVHRPDSSL